ncbi:hypothetical protein TNCV_3668131 [Trichonephila clavipes]|nr:hypothetical protein TNCV_3668131 [Trichonephila clavipes]
MVNARLVYQLKKQMHSLFQSGFRASFYIDDFQISCEGSDMRMIERQLQTAVNNIVKMIVYEYQQEETFMMHGRLTSGHLDRMKLLVAELDLPNVNIQIRESG